VTHSCRRAVLMMRSPRSAWTRREEPHAEHTRSRGKLSALTMPIWPQVQTTLTIMVLLSVSNGESAITERPSTVRFPLLG
jgi:hypothetical protein